MRKLLSLLLIVVLLFGLVACGGDKDTGGDSKGESLIDSISTAIKDVFE